MRKIIAKVEEGSRYEIVLGLSGGSSSGLCLCCRLLKLEVGFRLW